jgi:pyruvate dehydrogenase (quinone)
MQAAGILSPAPESINLNFAKIAEGAGIFGLRVDDPQEVRPALERAFAHDGPALVDVAVNRQELAMPLTLKMDEVADFNLYMIKAILNGRGGEIADLGQTNLTR